MFSSTCTLVAKQQIYGKNWWNQLKCYSIVRYCNACTTISGCFPLRMFLFRLHFFTSVYFILELWSRLTFSLYCTSSCCYIFQFLFLDLYLSRPALSLTLWDVFHQSFCLLPFIYLKTTDSSESVLWGLIDHECFAVSHLTDIYLKCILWLPQKLFILS